MDYLEQRCSPVSGFHILRDAVPLSLAKAVSWEKLLGPIFIALKVIKAQQWEAVTVTFRLPFHATLKCVVVVLWVIWSGYRFS